MLSIFASLVQLCKHASSMFTSSFLVVDSSRSCTHGLSMTSLVEMCILRVTHPSCRLSRSRCRRLACAMTSYGVGSPRPRGRTKATKHSISSLWAQHQQLSTASAAFVLPRVAMVHPTGREETGKYCTYRPLFRLKHNPATKRRYMI